MVTVTSLPVGYQETHSPRISSPRPLGIGGRGSSDTQTKTSRPRVSTTPFSFGNVIENSSPGERSTALHLTKIARLMPIIACYLPISEVLSKWEQLSS